ncbi:MAG: vWA domain-containing protein [Lachnospiraceae bacterium]|nr:vWA domain-containing protein [Lachnospiraceae bacterium]
MANFKYTRQNEMYDVDVCMLIDKTGSMRPIIDTVKQNALHLYDDIKRDMTEKGKNISNLRVRVMAFGDYAADGAEAFYGCDFLNMPEQAELLEQCVNSIRAEGGGDEPEDGLEALAFGIRSPWCTGNNRKRHIICLFTDASAHDLGNGRSEAGYPEDAPKSFEELMIMWGTAQYPGEIDPYAKRLLLFAPDCSYWSRIAREWDNTILMPVASGKGLHDVTYQSMLNTISNSI